MNTHIASQRSSLQLGGTVYKFRLLWVGHLATAPEAHLSSPGGEGEGRGGRGGTPLRGWAVARVMVIRGWSVRLIGRPAGRPGACTYPCQRTRVGADKGGC